MKKRALFSAVVATAIASALCVGLVGCGGKNEAKSMKSEEVDEAVWNAAFAGDSFSDTKIVLTETSSLVAGKSSGSYITKIEYIAANGLEYVNMFSTAKGDYKGQVSDAEVQIYKSGVDYYVKIGGKSWVKESSSPNPEKSFGLVESMISCASDYSKFEYSAANNGYIPSGELNNFITLNYGGAPVYKFKDGKFAGFYAAKKIEQGETTGKLTLSAVLTYGGQSLTLPTVAE